MRALVAVLVLSSLAGPCLAADKGKDSPPDWIRRPTPEMLRAVWPKAAMGRSGGGSAVIGCKVSLQGLLFDCKVLSETPEGLGFGGAAIAMTPQLLMRPARRDGQPVVSSVRIPVKFEVFGGGTMDSFGSRPVVRPAMAWQRAPTYQEVAELYPEKARAAALGGLVSLNCSLSSNGALTNCDVTREEPRGYGFGAAARKLAKLFQAFPAAPDQPRLAGASVQLPVAFDPAMLKPDNPVVGKPSWSTIPSAAEIAGVFPPELVGSLRVTLQCQVAQGGAVGDCRVEKEDPDGKGLGAGALKLTDKFRVSTWTMQGLPVVGGLVVIPIRYEVAAPKPPPAKP